MNTNSRKVLVPLATLLAAGAVAIGSGATFTSESVHTVAVTSGTLHHTNNHAGAALTVANLKPGDTQTGSLTITNDGTLDSTLALKPTGASSTFVAGAVNVKIVSGAKTLYNGDIAGLATAATWDIGALNKGQSATVDYTVSMATAATNSNQNKAASAGFQYVTTQTNDNGGVLSWVPGV